MSIPTTSAPRRPSGIAVVPSPQPRSSTRAGGVTPSDATRASPESRMKAAISVKSPFSQSALFGFMATPLLVGTGHGDTIASGGARLVQMRCRDDQADAAEAVQQPR